MRCLQGLTLIAIFLLVEVNAFFLKYILWIPPLNPLNTYRLCLYFLVGIPAVREYYVFIEGHDADVFLKLGPFAWLRVRWPLQRRWFASNLDKACSQPPGHAGCC